MNKSSDSTFRGLLEAAPDGILVVDSEGTIKLANAQCSKLFGFEPGELEGQPIEVVVPTHVKGRHATLRDGYFHSPHTRPMGMGFDLMAARKDGTEVPVEISLSPFAFDGKQCAIAIVRDVTEMRALSRELRRSHNELKRSIEELKRSNEELERFAYVASHDLQEPLRMITGYTQLLKRRYVEKLDAEAHEYIEFAVDGAKRMQSLINDLLAYSRLSTRSRTFATVNCADLMQQVAANMRGSIQETRATLNVGPLPVVLGDRTQLAQLFQNLLSNALKFSRPEATPVVSIKADRQDQAWRFSVADNGVGIDAAYAEKIFVIFQRLHTREQYPGTGIGLAICKKIVERHNGTIWFESTPNEGTTFFFTLPVHEDEN